jgi:hypothetical protein
MQKFPVNVRQMTPQEVLLRQAATLAREISNGDIDRVVLVSEDIILVVNQPGFDPYTWPKKTWRKSAKSGAS